jgi:riboflavin biosynthesis pyrimidine reductase
MQWLRPGDDLTDPLAPYLEVDRSAPPGPCWVLANMVSGLDGSVAIAGRVGELSSAADAELFRRMRSLADVVLVGAETVRRERYGPVQLPLELRRQREASGRLPVPQIAVVSRSLTIDWTIPAFAASEPAAPTMLVTCEAARPERLDEARAHASVLVAGGDRVEPRLALDALAGQGARVVLCEGGPSLLGEIIAADLLDELCLTMEPVMGGDPLPVAVAPPGHDLVRFRLGHALTHGSTLFLRYERAPRGDR